MGRKTKVTTSDSGGNLEDIIRENIKELREHYGLNQTQLAKAAKCKPALISMIEGGARKPSYKLLQRLADALHTHPSRLLVPKPKK